MLELGIKAPRTKGVTRVILHVTELPGAELPSLTRSLSRNDSQLLMIKSNMLPLHVPTALGRPQTLGLLLQSPGHHKEAYIPRMQAGLVVKPSTSGH